MEVRTLGDDQRSDWVFLLHDLMDLADRAQSLGQALQGAVDRISRELRWPVGHFFVPRDDGVLEFAGGVWKLPATGGEELILGSQAARYRPGVSWVGQAVEEREQIWISDLAAAGERFADTRLRPALDLGLKGLAVQPVTLGEEVVAVMEIFSSQTLPPSPHLRDLIVQAAAHLSRLAARLRVEGELRRAREEMDAGERARAEFLAGLSHRIRTPMNALIGMTELLMRTRLTEQQKDFTATVRGAGEEVMAILEDALQVLGVALGVTREERRVPVPREAGTAGADEGPLRVLVVEDNPVNQLVAVKMLEALGHRAAAVADGVRALDEMREERFDVVLMDVEMPEVDGFETTRRIRRGEAAGRQPYVIAMTARAMPGDREACLAAGMDDYLSKPVTLAALTRALAASRVAQKK